jgi:hypothetical protein
VIAHTSRSRLLSIGLVSAALIGLVGCESSASGPDFVAVGFSESGSKCSAGDGASSFAVGVDIHAVLTMSPALPTGGTVKVTMEKDGTELVQDRQTVTVTEPAPCIYSWLIGLEAVHYRVT